MPQKSLIFQSRGRVALRATEGVVLIHELYPVTDGDFFVTPGFAQDVRQLTRTRRATVNFYATGTTDTIINIDTVPTPNGMIIVSRYRGGNL